METFFSKIVALAIQVATCTHLLAPADVKFLGLTAADDSGDGEADAMDTEVTVSQPASPVSAGSLPTTTGTSTMDIPAVAGDKLAVGLQKMSVDPKSDKVIEDEEVKTILSTPTKPPLMSMWEGIGA